MFRLPKVLFFHLGQPTSCCLSFRTEPSYNFLLLTPSSHPPPQGRDLFLPLRHCRATCRRPGEHPEQLLVLIQYLSVSSYSYLRSREGRNLAELAFFLLEIAYFWHRENGYITTMYLCNQNSLLFPQTTSDPSELVRFSDP